LENMLKIYTGTRGFRNIRVFELGF
jgi:hypothetical protein